MCLEVAAYSCISMQNALNQVMKFRETIHLNMRAVTFRFVGTLPVSLSRLTSDDDGNEGEDFAIVMLGDQHPLKAFILAWNEEKDHFTGLIHLEQEKLCGLIRPLVLQKQVNFHKQQDAAVHGYVAKKFETTQDTLDHFT